MPYISDEELTQLRSDSEVLQLAIDGGFLTNETAAQLQLDTGRILLVEEEDTYEAAHDVIPSDIRHPEISVVLVGGSSNAFAIIGRVSKALRRAGFADEVGEFTAEATAGDYDDLLATCMRWVEVA